MRPVCCSGRARDAARRRPGPGPPPRAQRCALLRPSLPTGCVASRATQAQPARRTHPLRGPGSPQEGERTANGPLTSGDASGAHETRRARACSQTLRSSAACSTVSLLIWRGSYPWVDTQHLEISRGTSHGGPGDGPGRARSRPTVSCSPGDASPPGLRRSSRVAS